MPSWILLIIAFLPIVGGALIGLIKNNFKLTKILSYTVVILTSIATWLAIFLIKQDKFLILEIVKNYLKLNFQVN